MDGTGPWWEARWMLEQFVVDHWEWLIVGAGVAAAVVLVVVVWMVGKPGIGDGE